MTRRRRHHGPPRCRDCNARVVFFRSPHSGAWRPFDPVVLAGRDPRAAGAFPVYGQRAWRTAELIVELQIIRDCSEPEAASEVRDLPWHRPHDCPHQPERSNEQK